MNILEKAALDAMSLYQLYRHGGVARQVPVNGHAVPTQAFNALGSQSQDSDLAIVLLPGFGAIPNAASPGVIGHTARERCADFIRFFHPGLAKDFGAVTYDGMIDEAVAVAKNLPHKQLVLIGASFGGGMMEHVVSRLEDEKPNSVAGFFTWVSASPEALQGLFQRQHGWQDMANGHSERLVVHAPTYPKPLTLSRAQVDSVNRHAAGVQRSFKGAAVLYSGRHDPVARPEYSEAMAGRMGLPASAHKVLDCGHKIGPENIKQGLEAVLRAV